jgi:hypothetical protein
MLSRMPEVGATFVAAGALWQCGAGSAEGRRRYYVGLGWPFFSRPNWEFSLQEGAPPGCRRSMSGTDDTVSKPDRALAVMWTASVFSVDLGASAVSVWQTGMAAARLLCSCALWVKTSFYPCPGAARRRAVVTVAVETDQG